MERFLGKYISLNPCCNGIYLIMKQGQANIIGLES